jgi:hypothetical protein
MKNLRLVFNDINGKRKNISLPMEKWIVDWWFELDIVPPNDTVILVSELDGKSILGDITALDKNNVQFEEIALHFNWDGLYDDFIDFINESESLADNSAEFEKWLLKNIR